MFLEDQNFAIDPNETQGISWDQVKENANEIGGYVRGYVGAQAQNATNAAAFNAAQIKGVNQDTENKKVLIKYLSWSVLLIVAAIVVTMVIKVWRNK